MFLPFFDPTIMRHKLLRALLTSKINHMKPQEKTKWRLKAKQKENKIG